MKHSGGGKQDWAGVFAVPPLARKDDIGRSIDWDQNARLVKHMQRGGIHRLLYGGNAFLYHVTLGEYRDLLDWLSAQDESLWCVPAAGPGFGRLLDQAELLKRHRFQAVMHLPCSDPRDAAGLEAGLTEFVQRAGLPLIVYLKDEQSMGSGPAGLDVVGRLVDAGLCVGIKYAVVRADPAVDPYLEGLLQRVDRACVLSGIGERPAIVHMQKFGLPGYTTGSGCIGAQGTTLLFEACRAGRYADAAELRKPFLGLEDVRDDLGPARVLHAAVSGTGIADCGPIPPFVTQLREDEAKRAVAAASLLLRQPVPAPI